jgi:hypothetical protein
MSEFNDRIAAQRNILHAVNQVKWHEELFGLSLDAIDRWARSNKLRPDSFLLTLIREAADALFFLSNKSQEQVTEDYRLLANEVFCLTTRIRQAATQFEEKLETQ